MSVVASPSPVTCHCDSGVSRRFMVTHLFRVAATISWTKREYMKYSSDLIEFGIQSLKLIWSFGIIKWFIVVAYDLFAVIWDAWLFRRAPSGRCFAQAGTAFIYISLPIPVGHVGQKRSDSVQVWQLGCQTFPSSVASVGPGTCWLTLCRHVQ